MERWKVVMGNNSPTPKQVFGKSACGWSPLDDWLAINWPVGNYVVHQILMKQRRGSFGDPAYDDEQYLKNRGVW